MLAEAVAGALSFTVPCTVAPTLAVVAARDTSEMAVPFVGAVVELEPHLAAPSAAKTMMMLLANREATARGLVSCMRM
jgi:hypothetical protein